MSAVRKLEYIYETAAPSPETQRSDAFETTRVAQPLHRMLATVVVVLLLIALTSYLAFAVLQRHVEIDSLQFEIFNRQQAINKTKVMVDELYVIRESYMTIEEIESYATEELSMIKPSDQQKVILTGENYIELDAHVAFKTIPAKTAGANWWSDGIRFLSTKLDFAK